MSRKIGILLAGGALLVSAGAILQTNGMTDEQLKDWFDDLANGLVMADSEGNDDCRELIEASINGWRAINPDSLIWNGAIPQNNFGATYATFSSGPRRHPY